MWEVLPKYFLKQLLLCIANEDMLELKFVHLQENL